MYNMVVIYTFFFSIKRRDKWHERNGNGQGFTRCFRVPFPKKEKIRKKSKQGKARQGQSHPRIMTWSYPQIASLLCLLL